MRYSTQYRSIDRGYACPSLVICEDKPIPKSREMGSRGKPLPSNVTIYSIIMALRKQRAPTLLLISSLGREHLPKILEGSSKYKLSLLIVQTFICII